MLETKALADKLAQNSVVTKVLGRYLFQILEEVDREHIQPLEVENRRYKAALEQIASHPISSSASLKARAALSQDEPK
jgi:hypothetical protein